MDILFESQQHYERTIEFDSPWLHFERPVWPGLDGDKECQVGVIGGGISGIATVYYLLTETDKHVVLFEKERIASGATGNNAGLACIHIERPIQDLVEEFGLDKTRQSFLELDHAWDLMLSILDTIDAKELLVPLPNVTLSMSSVEVLKEHLGREHYNRAFGRTNWQYYVVDEPQVRDAIPKDLLVDTQFVSKDDVNRILQISDRDFVAAAVPKEAVKLGRLNSAKFCYQVLAYLLSKYPDRLCIYENTSISRIECHDKGLILKHTTGMIKAQDVVLCTNGYNYLEIFDKTGKRTQKLQNGVKPREGYLMGFVDNIRATYAQAFFDDRGIYADSPYFYLTHTQNFTVLGGPEFDQPECGHSEQVVMDRALASKEIYKKFLKKTYQLDNLHFSNFWCGIMGYTSNGIRWVGEDPQMEHVWFNLGCNGIGIVPAIGGAKRLIALMQGHSLPPTIYTSI